MGPRALLALAVAALAIVAAGCSRSDSSGSANTEIKGLGATLEEIQANARTEGEVNLVNWAGYVEKDWTDAFVAKTGCKVNSKVGVSSDEMVTLMKTGNYDGVSASGDATLRLIAAKDVAPVNLDLIPNYTNVFDGLKNQSHNTVNGASYGVAHGRGANLLIWNKDDVTPAPTTWDVVWNADSPAAGKISVYDSPIYIADAALHLKTTQPDLGIDNIYELDEDQFNAAVALLKQQKTIVGEYWGDAAKQIQSFTSSDSTAGTTWQYQVNQLQGAKDPVPVEGILPDEGSTGWSDTWMIASTSAHPNCMYLWMDYIISPLANAKATEYFGEAPVSPQACALTADKEHCVKFHAEDEEYFSKVYYWTTPVTACGDDRGDVCKDYSEWTTAWTEIRG
ncbi:MAG: spermidine/putrescine ABC transporter substrate-binding protein [Thermoleophilia bacterium]|nr:spermidine/putrescine ABC transporter substrate-binding protein [Thermoleophilia bacterium]